MLKIWYNAAHQQHSGLKVKMNILSSFCCCFSLVCKLCNIDSNGKFQRIEKLLKLHLVMFKHCASSAKSLSVLEGQFESCAYMKIRKLVHFRVHGPCRRCSIFFIFLYFPAEPVFSEVYLRPTKVEDIILGCWLQQDY